MKPTDALPYPPDWRSETIGKQIEIKRGISWSKEQEHTTERDDTVPVIRISNVQERLELDDILHLSGLNPFAVEKKRVSAGWSILVGSNGNRRRIGNAVFVEENADFVFASFLIAARPKVESGINPKYFYRWLTSEPVQANISATSEGSTGLSNLSHSFFRSMSIGIPSLDEQAAITRILDAVDTAIERAREAVERARQVKRSLVNQLLNHGLTEDNTLRTDSVENFSNYKLGRFPNDWTVTTLGKVCNRIVDGTHSAVETQDAGIPFLYVSCIRDGEIRWHRTSAISEQEYTKIARGREPKKGAVLYTAVGSYGFAAHINNDERFSFQRHVAILYPNENILTGSYLASWFNSEKGRKWSDIFAVGNAQKTVTLLALSKFPIAVPPITEQERINSLLESADKLVRSHSVKIETLNALKKSLMHDLLSGSVRVGAVKQLALFK